MNETKQVDKSHYEFKRYMGKARWNSVWHQLDEVLRLEPKSVLEIGPGPGVFKAMAGLFGANVETLDLDPELKPDHVGSVLQLPFEDDRYDVVCAFQVLEHLPYEVSLKAFGEIVRAARRYVIISLPDARTLWHYEIYLPKLGPQDFFLPRPHLRSDVHEFDGEHYWEINKRGYSLPRIINDLSKHIPMIRTYRVKENPYHRFFIFSK